MVDPASTPTPDAANLRECIPSNKQSTRPRTTPATTATACVQSADGRKRYLPVAQTQVGRTFYDLRLRLVLLVLRLRLRARRPSPPRPRARAHLAHTLRTHGDTPVPHTHTLYRLRYTRSEYIYKGSASVLSCSPRLRGSRGLERRRPVARWRSVERCVELGRSRHPREVGTMDPKHTPRRAMAARGCIPKLEGVQLSKMCRGSKRSCIY